MTSVANDVGTIAHLLSKVLLLLSSWPFSVHSGLCLLTKDYITFKPLFLVTDPVVLYVILRLWRYIITVLFHVSVLFAQV